MAAAEARTAWQRAANRCFVQEDAKRAPKLACCPSSSSTQQNDSSSGNATSGQEHPAPSFMPLNWNPMNSNLPPDTTWWLQLQPSFGYQKDFTCEQLNALEDQLEETREESIIPTLGESMEVDHKKSDCPSDSPWIVSTAFMKHDSEGKVEEMKTATNITQQPLKRKVDMGDYFLGDEELMDWKPVDRLISKKTEKASPDLETHWAGGNKCEPWWRVADKDELASLVAQKSLQHIENCDLPRPMHVSRDPFSCLGSLDSSSRIFSSSVGSNKLHSSICEPIEHAQQISTTERMDHLSSSGVDHLPCLHSARIHNTTTIKDLPEHMLTSESDSSRAQLLEALRHSQTRARKAEMAAQKAYNEKEHIVKLLFRQASHLFAYKQWLQMLQLESLCLQLRIKDHHISSLFPVLPWMPLKRNTARRKGGKQKKCSLCKCAVVFAVGLGLAGAGLLLGWTLGWLLPPF